MCPSQSGERPRALCLWCLAGKAGGFRGRSGGGAPSVGQASGQGSGPGVGQSKHGRLLARLWTLLALLCAYVAREDMKTHSPALTRNPKNRLRPLEVNKRLKKKKTWTQRGKLESATVLEWGGLDSVTG